MAKSAKPAPEPAIVAADWRKPDMLARWRGDFFGGTVAALIAVPCGMALAMAMGLRPEACLHTSIIGGEISAMISNAPPATPGLSATVVPVLAVLVRMRGVGGGVHIVLLFFVKRASIATRLEPIVPDPAEKEPSAINPIFKPRRNEEREDSRGSKIEDRTSIFDAILDPRSSVLDCLRYLRFFVACINLRFSDSAGENASRWRRSTSNSLQAPEENNHDQSTTLRPA